MTPVPPLRPAARLLGGALLCFSFGVAAMAGPHLGVLFKDKSPGFWTFAEKGAVETAQRLGAELNIKAPPSVLDVAAQPRLLGALVAEKIDVLIIAPTNPDAIEAQVVELAAKGVKIITVDTPLKDGIANTFVGADQAVMGEAAANLFVSLIGDGEEIALLRNNSLDRTVLIREEKLRMAIAGKANLTFHGDIYASSDRDSEEERAKLLLTKYPKTTAIFASATRGTLASIKAVRDLGLVGKVKVVGFGTYLPPEAAKAIEDGILCGWVAQQPKELGVKAVEAAVALADGKTVPAVLRPKFCLVTPTNYRSAEVQALLQP